MILSEEILHTQVLQDGSSNFMQTTNSKVLQRHRIPNEISESSDIQ